jgi:hypothetical protein
MSGPGVHYGRPRQRKLEGLHERYVKGETKQRVLPSVNPDPLLFGAGVYSSTINYRLVLVKVARHAVTGR